MTRKKIDAQVATGNLTGLARFNGQGPWLEIVDGCGPSEEEKARLLAGITPAKKAEMARLMAKYR